MPSRSGETSRITSHHEAKRHNDPPQGNVATPLADEITKMAQDKTNNDWTRRQFLTRTGTLAAATATAPLLNASTFRNAGKKPNDKLVIGLIGCGGMGAANMRNLMQFADVEVAAVCDVDSARMPGDINDVEKKYGRKPDVYSDYRKVLDRKDIDAIIVGTPDHWHALVLIHACEAGKDAYCEKPISHDIVEAVNMAGARKTH